MEKRSVPPIGFRHRVSVLLRNDFLTCQHPIAPSGPVSTFPDNSRSFGVLFLIVIGIFWIVCLALLGEQDMLDLARGAAAFAMLFAVCWCCDKAIARRRKWRERRRKGTGGHRKEGVRVRPTFEEAVKVLTRRVVINYIPRPRRRG